MPDRGLAAASGRHELEPARTVMKPSDYRFPVLPPEESRCVWMDAGILSYQLCDRAFDCDNCPLDAAMRKHQPGPIPRVEPPVEPMPGPEARAALREDCRYTRGHCWVRTLSRYTLRVGLEPSLGAALVDPREVVLPAGGQRLRREHACAWVVVDGGTLAIDAPATGITSACNEHLAVNPHLLSQEPFDHGWLFEMDWTAASTEDPLLLTASAAAPHFERHANAFRASLRRAMPGEDSRVGATLADGGEPLRNLAAVIGPRRYFELLRRAFAA